MCLTQGARNIQDLPGRHMYLIHRYLLSVLGSGNHPVMPNALTSSDDSGARRITVVV